MEVHELTEEEREQMLDEAFKMMKVARKHMPKGLMRMIRVTPTKIIYNHNKKGIANAPSNEWLLLD